MPNCDLCGSWCRETYPGLGLVERCMSCLDADLEPDRAIGPDGQAAKCPICRHTVALHAADVTEDGAPAHAGCTGSLTQRDAGAAQEPREAPGRWDLAYPE